VLALKEIFDFDDGNELPLLIAGFSLIETLAVLDERAEWVANARNFCGKKAVPVDGEGAASILVQDVPLRFRVRLPRGDTGS
jgi:hypothetical protein